MPDQGPRVRVLRVFSRLNIGGPSLHVVHLSAGLVAHGFETKLAVGQTGEHEGDFMDFATDRNVDITVVPELGRAIRPIADVRALIGLYRLARQYQPNILHTHTAKAGALGRLAGRLAGVPLVVHTYHGHVLSGYFRPSISLFFRGVERALAHTTDVLLTVSQAVKDDLVRLGVAHSGAVHVLPLGLDLEPLSRDLPRGTLRVEAGWSNDVTVVGVIGRLVPIKDIDTFLAAAQLIASSRSNVCFAVVGDGEERVRLESRAASSLGSRIRFFGWRKDAAAVFGDVDLVVNTSVNEGTPVALIEALAAGRPVVATAVGGTPDLLENGRFGTLIAPRSPEAAAQAVCSTLDSSGAAHRRAREGQLSVLARYSVDRLLRDMATLYRGLLARSSA